MSLLGPFIGISGVAFILAMSEFARAAKIFHHREIERKFVHILTACFVATWPFFMENSTILWLSVLLLLVVLLSKYVSLFHSVQAVGRPTYGELLYPVAIFLSAALSASEWVFAASMLYLGLADGLAAVVGVKRLGHVNYKIYGQAKSLVGTGVFYIVSLTITAAIVLWLDSGSYGSLALPVVIWLPLTAALVENFAVFGTDNLLVPLLVIAALNTAHLVV